MLNKKEHILNSRCKAFLDQNTLNMSNQILFQNKFGQFREHILPHVFLVMAKSHCTCTIVSKVAKIMHVVCKTFAREQEHYYMTSNEIWGSNTITHNHNCLMGTITIKVYHITPTSPRNILATILKAFWLFLFFMFFAYFSFKHIIHGHIRKKRKYPIM